jgi:hypothetical protein
VLIREYDAHAAITLRTAKMDIPSLSAQTLHTGIKKSFVSR